MKCIYKFIPAVIFILLFSCEDQGLIVKCPDCTADEPVTTDLDVKLDMIIDPNITHTVIEINVYEGNLEDSILYSSHLTSLTTYSIPVTMNKKYTVTASYKIGSNIYIAVDSATPRVRYEKTQCDNPCYFVYDKNIDLRLKYTN